MKSFSIFFKVHSSTRKPLTCLSEVKTTLKINYYIFYSKAWRISYRNQFNYFYQKRNISNWSKIYET